jgi:hypothetical protein
MALNRTLAQMRDAVQRTADIVAFTTKHPDSYVNDLLNRGLASLSTICRTTNPEFQPIASTTVACDGLNTLYALPANFRSLLSVSYVNTSNGGEPVWLLPFSAHERPSLTSDTAQTESTGALGYRVLGANIELQPLPQNGDTALVWYATTATQLTSDGDVADTFERLDTYVIWWAARELAQEREAWERYDRLTGALASLEADIRILARSVDLSHPPRMVHTRHAVGRDQYGRTRR